MPFTESNQYTLRIVVDYKKKHEALWMITYIERSRKTRIKIDWKKIENFNKRNRKSSNYYFKFAMLLSNIGNRILYVLIQMRLGNKHGGC